MVIRRVTDGHQPVRLDHGGFEIWSMDSDAFRHLFALADTLEIVTPHIVDAFSTVSLRRFCPMGVKRYRHFHPPLLPKQPPSDST
jgi:hypothetical protein